MNIYIDIQLDGITLELSLVLAFQRMWDAVYEYINMQYVLIPLKVLCALFESNCQCITALY